MGGEEGGKVGGECGVWEVVQIFLHEWDEGHVHKIGQWGGVLGAVPQTDEDLYCGR